MLYSHPNGKLGKMHAFINQLVKCVKLFCQILMAMHWLIVFHHAEKKKNEIAGEDDNIVLKKRTVYSSHKKL